MLNSLFILAALIFSFSASSGAAAPGTCIGTLEQLSQPQVQDISKFLLDATDPRLKQPFEIHGFDESSSQKLPSAASLFKEARFIISKAPSSLLPQGAKKIGPIEFGYQLANGFRYVGPLNYVVFGKSGRVIEVGGGSKEALEEFKSHLFGRNLSRKELDTISEINRKLISDLRSHPLARRKVEEFALKRKWPKGLEDEAQLAYFSDDITPIKDWAVKNGYSLGQMRDAGWLLLTFDRRGTPEYRVNYSNSIKIPFFADENKTGIPVWRTRNIEARKDGKKYLGWQLDRSINRKFEVNESLYMGWSLKRAEGKTVVITEGEFKCLVANHATGVLTVGIPGITQFDQTMINSLVAAKAKEYVVILDRDPKAKALMRVDQITDSERAAYTIARELEEAGARSVKVGLLPDVFDGSKVGIDDLILAKGPQAFLDVVNQAVDPRQYASLISMDTTFQELLRKRQTLGKLIKDYAQSASAGGKRLADPMVRRAGKAYDEANQAYQNYLYNKFNHARTLNQPAAPHAFIPKVHKNFLDKRKRAVLKNGYVLSGSAFADDILILDYVPGDVDPSICRPAPCDQIRYAMDSLEKAYAEHTNDRSQRSFQDFANGFLAGYLAHDFPPDEYSIELNVDFGNSSIAPLVIFKKSSGNAVAMARLRTSNSEGPEAQNLFGKIEASLRHFSASP